jgi:hypothetical protein
LKLLEQLDEDGAITQIRTSARHNGITVVALTNTDSPSIDTALTQQLDYRAGLSKVGPLRVELRFARIVMKAARIGANRKGRHVHDCKA